MNKALPILLTLLFVGAILPTSSAQMTGPLTEVQAGTEELTAMVSEEVPFGSELTTAVDMAVAGAVDGAQAAEYQSEAVFRCGADGQGVHMCDFWDGIYHVIEPQNAVTVADGTTIVYPNAEGNYVLHQRFGWVDYPQEETSPPSTWEYRNMLGGDYPWSSLSMGGVPGIPESGWVNLAQQSSVVSREHSDDGTTVIWTIPATDLQGSDLAQGQGLTWFEQDGRGFSQPTHLRSEMWYKGEAGSAAVNRYDYNQDNLEECNKLGIADGDATKDVGGSDQCPSSAGYHSATRNVFFEHDEFAQLEYAAWSTIDGFEFPPIDSLEYHMTPVIFAAGMEPARPDGFVVSFFQDGQPLHALSSVEGTISIDLVAMRDDGTQYVPIDGEQVQFRVIPQQADPIGSQGLYDGSVFDVVLEPEVREGQATVTFDVSDLTTSDNDVPTTYLLYARPMPVAAHKAPSYHFEGKAGLMLDCLADMESPACSTGAAAADALDTRDPFFDTYASPSTPVVHVVADQGPLGSANGLLASFDWSDYTETPAGVFTDVNGDDVTVTVKAYDIHNEPMATADVDLRATMGSRSDFTCSHGAPTFDGFPLCSALLAQGETDEDGLVTFTFSKQDALQGNLGNSLDVFVTSGGDSSHYQYAKNLLIQQGFFDGARAMEGLSMDGVHHATTPVYISEPSLVGDGYIAHYDWTGHDETPGGVQVQAAHDGTVTIAATIYEDLSPAPGIGVFLSGSTGESPGFPCPDSSGTGGYCSIVLASATTDGDGVATFTFDEADARMGRPGNAMDLFIQRDGASGSSHYQFAKNQLVANGLLMEADAFENYDGVSGVSRAMTPAFFGGGDMDGDGSQNVVEGAIGSDPREWQSQPGLLNIALNPGLEGDDDAADPDGDGVPHVEFRTSTFEATQVAPGAGRGGSDAANLAGEGKVAGHSVLGNIRLDVQQGVEFQDFHSGSFYFKIPSDFPDEIEKTQFRIYMALDGDGDGEFTHVKEDPNSQDHCVVFAEQGFRRDNNPEQYHDWQLVVFDKDTPAGMGPRSGTHCPGVGSDSPPVSEAMAQVPHATILSVSVQTQGYLAGFEHPEGHPIYVDDVALLVDNGPPTDLTDGWAVHIQPTKNNLPLPGASYDLAACRIGDVCPTSYDQAQFMVDQDGYYNFDVYADRVGHGYVDPSPDAGPDDDEFLAQRNTKEGKVTFRGDSKHAGPMTNSVFELRQQTLSGWNVVYRCSAFGPDACVGGGSLVQVPIDEVDTSDPLVAWAFIDVADGQEHDGVQGLEEETHVNSASGYFSIAKNSFEGYAITDLMDWGATPLFFDAYELPVDGFTAGISFPTTLNLPGTITTPDGQGYLTVTARPYERDAQWYAPQDNRELFLKVIGLDDEGVEVESAWILPEPADEDAGLYTFRVHLSDLPVDAEPANGYDFFVDQWGESGGRSSHHFLAKETAFNAGEYPLADAMDDSLEGQRLFTPVFVANADLSILPLACIDAADPEGFVAGLDGFGRGSALALDHDGDGSPTINELLAGSDPCNPNSTPTDWDGDGYSNNEECPTPNNPSATCTDPRDGASHPSDMSADEGPFAATAQPEEVVNLEFTFTNEGRATDSYTVTIELDDSDWANVSPTVAEQTLFGEGERNHTIFVEGVRSQETRTVIAQVTVPAAIADGAARGDEGIFTIDIEPHADDVATEGQFDFSPRTWTITTGEVTTYDLVFDQGVQTSQSALPAATVNFPFTISNTGNFEQDIAVTSTYEFKKAFAATPDLDSGYYTVLKADGATPFGATVSVPAQDSVNGILRVSVPDWNPATPMTGAYAGDRLSLTLTAHTRDDSEVAINADVTTREEYGHTLVAASEMVDVVPETPAFVTMALTHLGNGQVLYTLEDTGTAWEHSLLEYQTRCDTRAAPISEVQLDATGATTYEFCLRIEAPANLDWDDAATFTVKATDDQAPTPMSELATVTATVKPTYGVETMAPATTTAETWEGRPVVFEFDVENTGNGAASFNLSGSSDLDGWTAAFYGYDAGACLPDAIQVTGDIEEGATTRFCVEITPQHRDVDGNAYPHAQDDVAVIDVTASSQALGQNGGGADTWQATVTLCSLNTDEANGDENDLPDEPCAGAEGDLDDDNDGFSDAVEEDAPSRPLDKYSTPLDGDGDGIPNAVETFVDFDMQRDDELSEMAHQQASANGLPTMAVPDPTSIELITVYNVRVTNSLTQPVTRAFNTPLATLEPHDDGTWTVCVYEVRNPVDGSVTPVDECASGEQAEEIITAALQVVDDGYEEAMAVLDSLPGMALAALEDLGITQCPGSPCIYIDENGDLGFDLTQDVDGYDVGVRMDANGLEVLYPFFQPEDRDGDGAYNLYGYQGVGVNPMAGEGAVIIVGDEDDSDPATGGPADECIADSLPDRASGLGWAVC